MSRLGGALVCLFAVAIAALFLWGVFGGVFVAEGTFLGQPWSYWAIAIPVIIGFLGILALAFWIGWTMLITESEISKPQSGKEGNSSKTSGTSP